MEVRRFFLGMAAWFGATFAFGQHPALPPESAPPSPAWSDASPVMGGIYTSLDYLLWWMKPVCLKVPTLTGGAPADAVPGAFGQPGTSLLAGASRFEFSGASGLRPRVGLRSADGIFAVEAEGFALETVASHQGYQTQPGSPATYIPYIAPNGTNQALPFTIPGVVNGSVAATGTSHLWGCEANAIANVLANDYAHCRVQLGLLAGFRYLQLQDEIVLRNTQSLVSDPSVVAFGQNSLTTRNQFYGVQLGQRLEVTSARGSLSAFGKLAVGETNLANNFVGAPLVGNAVLPGLVPGPVQVLPSNSGYHSTYRVSLVPEIGTNMRLNITDRATVSLGYSLLYWNRILCPGDLMDPRVNATQLPFRGPVTGAALPAVNAVHTDYFAHGINAGFEFRF